MSLYSLFSHIRHFALVLLLPLLMTTTCAAYTHFLWVNTDSVFQVDNLYYRFLSCKYELSNPVRQIDSVQVFVASPPDGVAYGLDDYVVRPSITFNNKEYKVTYIDTCAFADAHIRSISIPALGFYKRTEILHCAFLNATIDGQLTLGESGRLVYLRDSIFCGAEIGELMIHGNIYNRYVTEPYLFDESQGGEFGVHQFDNVIIHHLDYSNTECIDCINGCTIDKITFGNCLNRILNCFNNCVLPAKITIGPSIHEIGESFSNSTGFNEFVVEDSDDALAGIFGYVEPYHGGYAFPQQYLLLLELGYGLEHSPITKLYIGRNICGNVRSLRSDASGESVEYWNGEKVDDISNIPFGTNMFENVEEIEFGRKGMMEDHLPTMALFFPSLFDTICFNTIHQATHLKKVVVHETDTVRDVIGMSNLDMFGAVFSNDQYAEATLYVPKGYINAYRNHVLWGKFANIVEYVDHSFADLNKDGVVDIADVNQIINAMLGKAVSNELQAASDVTGDGLVDISDVNAIINAMLGKE
ncbi:MAG: dockerin type I repeat-containing protein [Muribaculaceae bacterium]|nr:dockerin type I repeat-containing protein [Muribaculaceae bacterium]